MKKRENNKKTIRDLKKAIDFMFIFLGPPLKRRWYIFGAIFFILLVAVGEPWIYKQMIDLLVAMLNKTSNIDYSSILFYVLTWLIIGVFGFIFSSFYSFGLSMAMMDMEYDYLKQRDKVLMNMDIKKYLDSRPGEISSKVSRVPDGFWHIGSTLLRNLLPDTLKAIAILIFVSTVNWRMTILMIILMPFFSYVYFVSLNKTSKLQKMSNDKMAVIGGKVFDRFAGLLLVRSFARERDEVKRFSEMHEKVKKYEKRLISRWTMFRASVFSLYSLNRLVILTGGIFLVLSGELTVGGLIMCLAFSNVVYAPIQQLGDQLQTVQKSLLVILPVKELFEDVPKIQDVIDAKKLIVAQGRVEFNGVLFSYHKKEVVKKIFCVFEAGKVTALVGHSGAGKSTITSLINRFYDLSSGKILIDGQNIAEVTQESLRLNIGMVMQDNPLFNDTILNNLKYGNAKVSMKEVILACKKANFYDFAKGLPKKFNTLVGERGLKLSGGERQRLAIARVILKDPKILILDEATSALDSENEKQIQEALKYLMKGRTSIVIAHRLSTVRHADKIIVLKKGKIVEQGTHETLMRKKGAYHHLVDLQISGFLGE